MSDKKNKDNRKEDTKSKKNMKKTQEMPVSTELKTFPHSCTDCGVLNCSKRNASYPEFCLTEKLTVSYRITCNNGNQRTLRNP